MEGKVRKLTSCVRSCLVAFVINAKITGHQGELHHVAVLQYLDYAVMCIWSVPYEFQ